jgi:hypothetical protein
MLASGLSLFFPQKAFISSIYVSPFLFFFFFWDNFLSFLFWFYGVGLNAEIFIASRVIICSVVVL